MTAEERKAYLFLSLLQARTGSSVISRLGDIPPASLMEMPLGKLQDHLRLTDRALGIMDELRRSFDPDTLLEQLAEKGIAALTLPDAGYPEKLREIPDPPPALYVDGEIPDGPSVALVGSRKASVTGLDTARKLGRELAKRGVCVISGLALGIDAAAHEGALEAGGTTTGVLGCGIDVVYPRRNRELYEKVRRSGALISEYFLGEAPLAWHFPARNRVIAGLADVLVVVEAAEKSGALITARHALDAGRDVWAVPGPVGLEECRGSNKLIADGAAALWDIPEFVESVAPQQGAREKFGPALAPKRSVDGLPDNEAAALAWIGFQPTEADVISRRSGIEMRELLPALALLELKGYITRDSTGAFVRRGAG